MGKFSEKIKMKYKQTTRKSVIVYLLLRILVIVCIVYQILLGNIWNVVMCIVALFLFTIPNFVSEKLKIGIPSLLESLIYIFIYSAAILGEINNFYNIIPFWDSLLHTLNGFLCAGIGFALVDLLNQNSSKIQLSPLYMAIGAICFSMTIGILWEFYEYSTDTLLKSDMQKDEIVTSIASTELNENGENVPIKIDNIEKTVIYTKDGEIITIENGYLDIGLKDTMKDLIVNLIGAVVYSIIGVMYIQNRDKYKLAKEFIPVRKTNI